MTSVLTQPNIIEFLKAKNIIPPDVTIPRAPDQTASKRKSAFNVPTSHKAKGSNDNRYMSSKRVKAEGQPSAKKEDTDGNTGREVAAGEDILSVLEVVFSQALSRAYRPLMILLISDN